MADYYTISDTAEGIYKEKNSRFISYAFPLFSKDDIKHRLEEVKKDHPQARHICYAYNLGYRNQEQKASDAGEPANTAGAPILNAIKSRSLTNILVIVVRYFGGTKLGVPGLIHAYRESAMDALAKAQIIEDYPKSEAAIEFPYIAYNEVLNFLRSRRVKIIQQQIDETVTMSISYPSEIQGEMTNRLSKVDGLLFI